MNDHKFNLSGEILSALPSGALWWEATRTLVLSDLHLGKSERIARRGGTMLPPYEIQDTFLRLEEAIAATNPAVVVCLGDSFDDDQAASNLDAQHHEWLLRLQAGREWIWIAGNHDPAPIGLGGSHRRELARRALVFRHIAQTDPANGTAGEVSGHYHPKARIGLKGRSLSRPCFLYDEHRVILPAFGTYTGGLRSDNAVLCSIMAPNARAVLTGKVARAFPMPR